MFWIIKCDILSSYILMGFNLIWYCQFIWRLDTVLSFIERPLLSWCLCYVGWFKGSVLKVILLQNDSTQSLQFLCIFLIFLLDNAHNVISRAKPGQKIGWIVFCLYCTRCVFFILYIIYIYMKPSLIKGFKYHCEINDSHKSSDTKYLHSFSSISLSWKP